MVRCTDEGYRIEDQRWSEISERLGTDGGANEHANVGQPYDLLLPGCLPFARVEAADQRQKINSSTLRSLGPVDSLDLFYYV